MKFSKPPLSIEAQVQHIKQRGLVIPDEARAAHYLSHLNYYRLRAYWLPLEADSKQHAFNDGASFETALDFYVFDRKLRLLLLDAIERIEVSLRTQWSYHLALKYGSHAYLDPKLFRDQVKFTRALDALAEEVKRSDETFIRHYQQTYTDPALPPIWVVTEILTLGQLSRWYENLAQPSDRQAVARIYGLDEKVVSPNSLWEERLVDLFKEHSEVDPVVMGFPLDWAKLSIWCDGEWKGS